MASEAMPSAMAKPLNVISSKNPISACRTRNSAPWMTLTWPEGGGEGGERQIRRQPGCRQRIDPIAGGIRNRAGRSDHLSGQWIAGERVECAAAGLGVFRGVDLRRADGVP